MTDLVPVSIPAVVVERDERTVRLGDIGIARENLRFNEPPDDDLPTLAATIKAAGQLQRLTVRPGRGRKEEPWIALDGRRRRLALGLLLDAGGNRRELSGHGLCRDRPRPPGSGRPADEYRRACSCRRYHRRHRPDAEIEADGVRDRPGPRLRRDRHQTPGRLAGLPPVAQTNLEAPPTIKDRCRSATINPKLSPCQRQSDRTSSNRHDHRFSPRSSRCSHSDRRAALTQIVALLSLRSSRYKLHHVQGHDPFGKEERQPDPGSEDG